MNRDKLKHILGEVQKGTACHQKYLKVLVNLYNKSPFEEFCQIFVRYLELIFNEDIVGRNPYIERCLDFCSKFVTELAKETDKGNETPSDNSEDPSHPFLARIIEETLQYHDLNLVQARYYSCKFIMLILQNIGYDMHLDNDICDSIQEAMLERILDPKPMIRLQAITALVRLQEPLNPECPVIKAYLLCFTDASAAVRKEVVKVIAPNAITIPKIKDRVRDVDYSVRLSAFARCADIGPRLFKIVDRQSILTSGFSENNKLAKQVFLENLIPKWLTNYNGDFLQFISAIKLDADEEDIQNTADICKKLMEVFFRSNPIKDIINVLPVEEKLVPIEKLSTEVVTYWRITTNYLRDSKLDDTEDYLDDILPELMHFSNYIERVLKHKSQRKMDEWEYLDFQNILLNLLEMVERYDFSDEVGRRTLHTLILSVLQNHKFSMKLISKMVQIVGKLSTDMAMFTIDMCQVISDIREPLVDEQLSEDQIRKRDFQLAEVKVKMNILNQDKDEAVENQDFEKAMVIQKQLNEMKNRMEEINKQFEGEKVKVAKDDTETLCRCLDILICMLQLPSIKTLSDSLRSCKQEFVMPLITNGISEIHWRVLKCLALFCIIDKATAEESAKIICIPIAMYRTIPNYDKSTLIVAVEAVSDLIRLYSANLFCPDDEDTTTNSNQSTRRKLYRNEDMDETTVVTQNKMNVEFIIEIILDMLDDENDDIRNTAIVAVAKLIMDQFTVSPYLLSRMILKWYSPLTEKQDVKLQQKLGVLIERYTETIKGAKEIAEKAVIPTLSSIANAPKTSPLADIDVDNVLRFLAAITNTNNSPGIVNVHRMMAHSLCYKIASKPHDCCVAYMAKMLLYLEIPPDDDPSTKELISQAELLLEDIVEKAPRRNISKFVANLKGQIANVTNSTQHSDLPVANNANKTQILATVEEEGSNDSYRIEEFNSDEINKETQEDICEVKEEKKKHEPKEDIHAVSEEVNHKEICNEVINVGVPQTNIQTMQENICEGKEDKKKHESNEENHVASEGTNDKEVCNEVNNDDIPQVKIVRKDYKQLGGNTDVIEPISGPGNSGDEVKKPNHEKSSNKIIKVNYNKAAGDSVPKDDEITSGCGKKRDKNERGNNENHKINILNDVQIEPAKRKGKDRMDKDENKKLVDSKDNGADTKEISTPKNITKISSKPKNNSNILDTKIISQDNAKPNSLKQNKPNVNTVNVPNKNNRNKTKVQIQACSTKKSLPDSSSTVTFSSSEETLPRKTRAMLKAEKITSRLRNRDTPSSLNSSFHSSNSSSSTKNVHVKKRQYHSTSPSVVSLKSSDEDSKSQSSTISSTTAITYVAKPRFKVVQDSPKTYARKQRVVVELKAADLVGSKKRIIERKYPENNRTQKVLKLKQAQEAEKKGTLTRKGKKFIKSEPLSDVEVLGSRTRGKRINVEKLLNLSPRTKSIYSSTSTSATTSMSTISSAPIAESTRNHSRSELNSSNEENSSIVSNLSGRSQQTKRRKNRSRTSKDVSHDESTVLHTIIEQSMDVPSLLEDDSFLTPDNSLKGTPNRHRLSTRRSQLVISDTSSDSEQSSGSSIRRSTRKLKKKKLDGFI